MSKPFEVKKATNTVIQKFLPGATTVAKKLISDKAGLVQNLSNVVQRTVKDGLLKSFLQEWEDLSKDGKVNVNFVSTDTGAICFQELIDALDKEMPDRTRFELLKQLYFSAAAIDSNEQKQMRLLQLLKVSRKLDATEILIIRTCYNLVKIKAIHLTGADPWAKAVSDASGGLLSVGIIERYEEQMIEGKLIAPRIHADKSGIARSDHWRLCNLAIEICEFLESKI